MKPNIIIDHMVAKDGYLHLHIQGVLENCHRKDKIRILLLFTHDKENRRLPVEIKYRYKELPSLSCELEGEIVVDLPFVFYKEQEFLSCNMKLILEYGMDEIDNIPFAVDKNIDIEGIEVSQNNLVIIQKLFQRKVHKKEGFFYRIYQVISFIVCFLFLPFFLIDALLAIKGVITQYPKNSKEKGIKAILRHINYRTKRISGLSYSTRDLKTQFFTICYNLMKTKPIIDNRILFLSERLTNEKGNLLRIYHDLATIDDKLEYILWQKEKTVSQMSLKELYTVAKYIATSKVVVLDDFYPQLHALYVKKETTIIQLWHACGAFKTFGFTRMGKPGGVAQDSLNHRSYDLVFVSGENIRGVYSETFGIPIENVKALGVPRTDVFFDKEYEGQVKEKLINRYPNLRDKKVILFAPTFRGDGNRDAYYPVQKLNLNHLLESLPDDYVIIIKNHPFVKNKFVYDLKYSNRVVDTFTSTEDINDLLFVTDLLITDYSSVIFEAALRDIPMIFYTFDLEDYMENRDIYYDYSNFVPGPIVMDQEELIREILVARENNRDSRQFREYFLDALDGKSTKRITDYIYNNYFSKQVS
ncbi:CDP-glycerol glycerophosphotransferase family protein [Anaeromicropila herbilytica]|uniref:Uncharacterized protein n=1 Tax=Anaeromicropila herbilytica TaxID=2785025 RepID=A0A7R7EJ94_9FIRM|nr:CDP-glycerol glycerophosphotransferase family protein [Anaeromicropila herbilytica]BCN29788.1 hypothetical protein bsdtb5_10830 [Anaeromicropila herbilytica]